MSYFYVQFLKKLSRWKNMYISFYKSLLLSDKIDLLIYKLFLLFYKSLLSFNKIFVLIYNTIEK